MTFTSRSMTFATPSIPFTTSSMTLRFVVDTVHDIVDDVHDIIEDVHNAVDDVQVCRRYGSRPPSKTFTTSSIPFTSPLTTLTTIVRLAATNESSMTTAERSAMTGDLVIHDCNPATAPPGRPRTMRRCGR